MEDVIQSTIKLTLEHTRLTEYLKVFPDGQNARLAREALKRLKG
jgi:hypothetical protein